MRTHTHTEPDTDRSACVGEQQQQRRNRNALIADSTSPCPCLLSPLLSLAKRQLIQFDSKMKSTLIPSTQGGVWLRIEWGATL